MPKTTRGWGFRISGEGNINSECGVPTFETGLQNQGLFEIINELMENDSIIICPADQGKAFVLEARDMHLIKTKHRIIAKIIH